MTKAQWTFVVIAIIASQLGWVALFVWLVLVSDPETAEVTSVYTQALIC